MQRLFLEEINICIHKNLEWDLFLLPWNLVQVLSLSLIQEPFFYGTQYLSRLLCHPEQKVHSKAFIQSRNTWWVELELSGMSVWCNVGVPFFSSFAGPRFISSWSVITIKSRTIKPRRVDWTMSWLLSTPSFHQLKSHDSSYICAYGCSPLLLNVVIFKCRIQPDIYKDNFTHYWWIWAGI